MSVSSFNNGWSVGPKTSIYAALQGASSAKLPVTLPHDALIAEERSAERGEGPHNGYFPSAAYDYSKTFTVGEDKRMRRLTLEIQGAHRDAVVYVNDAFAGQRPNGYTTFFIPLDPFLRYGAENTVRVELRSCEDSRWYTGAGLYRDVLLHDTPLVHIGTTGPRVTTPDVDDERAVIEVETPVTNEGTGTATLNLRTVVRDPAGTSAAVDTAPVTVRAGETVTVRQRVYVAKPRRWSVDSPTLYELGCTLGESLEADERNTTFGIRTLRLDPVHGLRINDEPVKLRGACVHHDNGILGAAAIAQAEERRVRILKESGFNAIRSAHNPISQAMLDACDRLGMLVMDETFDVWTVSKSTHDYSLAFPEWWERDISAMVTKDFNHPSVIMYSIGNENPENGDGLAGQWGRHLAEKIRALDSTRFVTNGVNGLVAAIADLAAIGAELAANDPQGVNDAMNDSFMNRVSSSAQVTARTAEAFSVLDIAGMNYGDSRYELDKELFPNRIIVGTETFPASIGHNWALVEKHSHVLGDFTWTGWDYLGESGAGRITYLDGDSADATPKFEGGFPWLTAWTGDIDITGHRRPVSYFRETVFGLRKTPYIAVQRPETFGRANLAGAWSWSDSVSGWSWDEQAGRTAVEVYSSAEEIELLLNGRVIGREPAGRRHGYIARFELEFEPGELTAVGYMSGEEQSRSTIRSAGSDLMLAVTPERTSVTANTSDLAYIPIEVRDTSGNLSHAKDRSVTVEVAGAGVLQGLGSGRPDQRERYDHATHTTFDGRVLAIVRPTGAGIIDLTVTAEGLEPASVQIVAAPATGDRSADLEVSVTA